MLRGAARSRACAAEADLRNEKIGYKVREHSLAKVPVMLVVGKRETEQRSVAVRRLGAKDQQAMALDAAMRMLAEEAVPPDLRHGSQSRRRPRRAEIGQRWALRHPRESGDPLRPFRSQQRPNWTPAFASWG